MKLKSKRTLVLIGVLAVAVFAAVGAYAYFSSSGSGSGSASVGSSGGINLSSDAVGPLYPGAAATPVAVHVHNGNNGAEYVGTISGSVADNAGCLGSWFTVGSVTYNQDVAGNSNGPDGSSSIALNDSGTNQDACQGKTMTISWSSN